MTIHITLPDALRALREAVEEKGWDYEYPDAFRDEDSNCMYVVDDAPACIVGNALHRLGVPVEELAKNNTLNFRYRELNGVGISGQARMALNRAQRKQDGYGTWGDALRASEEVGHWIA